MSTITCIDVISIPTSVCELFYSRKLEEVSRRRTVQRNVRCVTVITIWKTRNVFFLLQSAIVRQAVRNIFPTSYLCFVA